MRLSHILAHGHFLEDFFLQIDDAFYKTTSSHNLTFSESTKELTISEEKPYRSRLFSKSKYLQDRYSPVHILGFYPANNLMSFYGTSDDEFCKLGM